MRCLYLLEGKLSLSTDIASSITFPSSSFEILLRSWSNLFVWIKEILICKHIMRSIDVSGHIIRTRIDIIGYSTQKLTLFRFLLCMMLTSDAIQQTFSF